MLNRRHLITIAASLVVAVSAYAQDKSIVVASTTSTEDSGLFKHILPLFKAKTGIDVKVVAQVAAVTPMSYSSTPSPPRKNSSPKASA